MRDTYLDHAIDINELVGPESKQTGRNNKYEIRKESKKLKTIETKPQKSNLPSKLFECNFY
jgi:hypothetical protein